MLFDEIYKISEMRSPDEELIPGVMASDMENKSRLNRILLQNLD